MAMVEPFWSTRQDGRVTNLLDPDSVIRSVHIAAGLGATSAYTWLKLPVVDDLDRVMEATTLPTLLLGGDPTVAPEETYASWGKALEPPVGPRTRRRPSSALPTRRRCGRRRRPSRHPRPRRCRMTRVVQAGRFHGAATGFDVDVSPGEEGLGAHRPVRRDAAPRTVGRVRHRGLRVPRPAACPGRPRSSSTVRPCRSAVVPTSSPVRPTSPTCRAAPRIAVVSAGGARIAFPHAKAASGLSVPPDRRRAGRDRTPWRRCRVPAGPQLRHAGGARGRLDHRLRGAHPGRELVVVPAAQARRAQAW